jgi:hypothetical protein
MKNTSNCSGGNSPVANGGSSLATQVRRRARPTGDGQETAAHLTRVNARLRWCQTPRFRGGLRVVAIADAGSPTRPDGSPDGWRWGDQFRRSTRRLPERALTVELRNAGPASISLSSESSRAYPRTRRSRGCVRDQRNEGDCNGWLVMEAPFGVTALCERSGWFPPGQDATAVASDQEVREWRDAGALPEAFVSIIRTVFAGNQGLLRATPRLARS